MTAEAIISGLTLGLVGSFHCMGMCGPLSLALPLQHKANFTKSFYLLFYQFGRITTYAAFGLLFGLAGRSIYIQGYQQWFSIVLGAIVLLLVFLYFLHRYSFHVPFLKGYYSRVQQLIGSLFQKANNPSGFFVMGMANGLLPCGMVYVALITTLSFSTVGESVGFMSMFGAGTLPAMMMVGLAGQFIRPSIKTAMQKVIPFFVLLVGVLLVLRGLDLGIPFVSPALPAASGNAVVCHP